MIRFSLRLILAVWVIAAPVLAFTVGVNLERDRTPVCYAATEDSELAGCHYIGGDRDVWVRDPASPYDILIGYRRGQ